MADFNRGERRSMGDKRVTLRQVAQKAGVSQSTASFALTGRVDQRIAPQTIKKVKEAARLLGYRPNQTAKILRTGKSGTVGLISDFVGTTSMANGLINGVLRELRLRDKLLLTADSQGDQKMEKKLIDAFLDRQVEGILYTSMFTRETKMPSAVSKVPAVMLNCLDSHNSDCLSVVPDEYEGGRQAAKTLIQAGHSNHIWFVGTFPEGVSGGPEWHGWVPWALGRRIRGICDELSDQGLALEHFIDVTQWTCKAGRSVGKALADSGRSLPTAFICVNDALAYGLMQELQIRGVQVPDDVSFVAFDNSMWSEAGMPKITSICLPHEELGRQSVEMLFGDDSHKGLVTLNMPLNSGNSVGKPRL